ncbi:MAG: IPExxxVDY family protein [Bacteroidota bacterium]
MALHSLDIYDDEHFDFDIISISSSASIYSVISELNQSLNIDLKLRDFLDFSHKEGEQFLFPLYTHLHEELNIEFNLISNQTSFQSPDRKSSQLGIDLFSGNVQRHTKLLAELEKSDYFLIIKGDNRFLHNYSIIEAIKNNVNFISVHEIYLEKLKDKKSKTNLLF